MDSWDAASRPCAKAHPTAAPVFLPAPLNCYAPAANNTFWNLYATPRGALAGKVFLPGCDFGPRINFVGNLGQPTATEGDSGDDRRRRRRMLDLGLDDFLSDAMLAADGDSLLDGRQQLAAAANETTCTGYCQFPGWCSRSSWYVEACRPQQRLQPPDLHAAMVATRQVRLGGL